MTLRDQLMNNANETSRLLRLADAIPDLRETRNRWNHLRYVSKSANARATDCDISHNCGCCPDSPLEVWPYVMIDGVRVYSDPPSFTVGERCDGGELEWPGWEKSMKDAGIADVVIAKVANYLEAHKPVIDDESEEDGDQ